LIKAKTPVANDDIEIKEEKVIQQDLPQKSKDLTE
jgi:hypothetical protein